MYSYMSLRTANVHFNIFYLYAKLHIYKNDSKTILASIYLKAFQDIFCPAQSSELGPSHPLTPRRVCNPHFGSGRDQWWAAILKNVSFKAIQIHNF
jgi:hypothetical protein